MQKDLERIEKKIDKFIKENDLDHDKIRKALFGNGQKGTMEQVRDNAEHIEHLAKAITETNTKTAEYLKDLPVFIQSTRRTIESLTNSVQTNKDKCFNNERIIDKYVAQLGVWRWLAGFLGIGNIGLIIKILIQ